MKNIEYFNLAVGEILGECYSKFPVPAYITKATIGSAVKEYYPDYDPTIINLGDPEYQVAQHTISWLAKAGFIWLADGNESSTRVKATLSPKGLEVLNATPKSLSGSIGSNLAKGAKTITMSVFQNLVGEALSQGINFNAVPPQI